MKKLLTILTLVTLGISGAAHATECKFYASDDVLIMSPGAQPVITPLPVGSVTTPVQISNTILMETNPVLKTHCGGGDDGADVYQLTDNAMLDGYIDDKATFRTNIAGIVYTLAFYPDGNGVTAWFPPMRASIIERASWVMIMTCLMRKTGTFVWSSGKQTALPASLRMWIS